jgi:hypothetical protein
VRRVSPAVLVANSPVGVDRGCVRMGGHMGAYVKREEAPGVW